MANLEAKMARLAHFWEPLGDFFWILGAILLKIAKIKKQRQYITLKSFLGVLRLLLEGMLGYLGAMLGDLGAMLAHLGAMSGYVEAS